MAVQHLRVDPVSRPPQQRRRALNVGEQKRESLHGHSVEAPPGCGPASSHTITPDRSLALFCHRRTLASAVLTVSYALKIVIGSCMVIGRVKAHAAHETRIRMVTECPGERIQKPTSS